MKKKLRTLLCVLLGIACMGFAVAASGQGKLAIWQTYVLRAEWAQMDIDTPEGMQEATGMQFVRVHFTTVGEEVPGEDIGEYAGGIVLRHAPDGEEATPEMYTSYSTVLDEETGVYETAETQAAFDLLYQAPAGWTRESITLVVPPAEGEDTLIPLDSLPADPPPGQGPVATQSPTGVTALLSGTHRLTLSPSATVELPGLPEEQAKLWSEAAQYLEQLQAEVAFTLLEGNPYLEIRLLRDGVDLGVAEAYLDGDLLYVRGDMLPEGWVTLSLRELLTGAASPGVLEREASLPGMVTAWGQVADAFGEALEAWVEARPEGSVRSEHTDLESWPRYYFLNAYSAERFRLSADAIQMILRDAESTLIRQAAQGELVDLDGTPIRNEDEYEDSLLRQLIFRAQSWNLSDGMSFCMDTVSGAGNFMEASCDLTSLDYGKVMMLVLRRLPRGGNQRAYSGEIQWADSGESMRLNAHLDVQADQEAGQYSLRADGSRYLGGSDLYFDGDLGLTLPVEEDTRLMFMASGEAGLYIREDALTLSLRADAGHNTDASAQGAWDDCTLDLYLNANLEAGEASQSAHAELNVRYQRTEEEPVLHALSDVRLHVGPELTTEEQDAYIAEFEETFTSWLLTALSTLPAELLQVIIEAAGGRM